MDVLSVLMTLGAAVLVLGAPGLPTALALRLRPLTTIAATVPTSLLMVAVSAEIGHVLGIPWSFASPLVLGLLVGGVLAVLMRRRASATARAAEPAAAPDGAGVLQQHEGDRTAPAGRFLATARGRAIAVLTGLLLGGGCVLVRALTMMGGLNAVNQTYDNVFHLNAVRHILRNADGSAWVVGGLTTLPGNEGYYPAAWHQLVSLVVQLSGQEIVLGSNVVMLLLAAVVWPVGLMALMRTCTTAGPVGWMAAGTLAGVTGDVPLSLMYWGIVLPYFLSMSLMPLIVIMVGHLAGLAPRSAQRLSGGQVAVLLPVVCAAIALAHPQGVFVGMVLGLPILVWGTAARARDRWAPGLAPAPDCGRSRRSQPWR